MCQLMPLCVDCSPGIKYFPRVFGGDGLMHQTMVEFGQVSLLGDLVHVLL